MSLLRRTVALIPCTARYHGRSRLAALLAAAAIVLLGVVPAAGAQEQLRRIDNRASVTDRDANGNEGTAEAASTIFAQIVSEVRVTPNHSVELVPGQRNTLRHWVKNAGAWMDQFFMTITGPGSWIPALYHDRDGNGELSLADAEVEGSFSIAGGDSIPMLLVVTVPANQGDTADVTVEIRATSLTDAAATAAARNIFTVRGQAPILTIQKSVNFAQASVGDTLTYSITLANVGAGAASGVELVDLLPRGVRYLKGSQLLTSTSQDRSATSPGSEPIISESDGRQRLTYAFSNVAPATSTTITFKAVIIPGAPYLLVNTASLSHAERQIVSEPAETRILRPLLQLEKEHSSTTPVTIGTVVTYTLRWSNPIGNTSAFAAVVVDTLAENLAFVSASGSPVVTGQVVTWEVGNIEPGGSGSAQLSVRVLSRPANREISNRATITAGNAAALADAKALVVAEDAPGLKLSKSANVLETSLGERIVYSLTAINSGNTELRDVVVRDLLPEGTKLVDGRTVGADSVRVDGRNAAFWLARRLASGQSVTLTYALTVAAVGTRRSVDNVAVAQANAGTIRSDTAAVTVPLRGGFVMESRVVIGKVWFDADGDGIQGPTEYGVGGLDVWSADGNVVTTDVEGRFSFANLGYGTHLLRLDMRGAPGGMELPSRGAETVRVRTDGWTTPSVSFRLINAPMRRESSPVIRAQDAFRDTLVGPLATIALARTADERADEERQSLVSGPVVRIAAPVDGSIVLSNRLYVGVRGEPGAAVRLFNGDRVIGTATLRPDGVADFVGVDLPPGTSRLRVAMIGSWGTERWDSVHVHRVGAPARIEGPRRTVAVQAGGYDEIPIVVRVTDEWGVPLSEAYVTVAGNSVIVGGQDADLSSVGLQMTTALDGTLLVRLRGGRETGEGEVRVSTGSARAVFPVRVVPENRPLIVTGHGELGMGATAKSSAAVVVRGSIGNDASLTLSYDTRRADDTDDFFRRGQDMLDEARYPTLGDAGEARVITASRQAISARIERGLDWVELGDVRTADFGSGALSAYRRSLTGVAGRLTTGALTWRGYGSVTNQVLTQQQIRADGSSGPYNFDVDSRPGTERIAVEVRARDNAARVISRHELTYGVDYQIDYRTGVVLLQRPILAADGDGNPVFLIGIFERRAGGEQRVVGGLGTELDVARLARIGGVDTLALSLGFARDADAGESNAGNNMVSGGVRARFAGFGANAELLRSQAPDSSAVAARAELEWNIADRLRLDGSWLRVGEGFSASADPSLRAGVEELRGSAILRLSRISELGISHERQYFREQAIERQRTAIQAMQKISGRAVTAEAAIASDGQEAGASATSATGKLTLALAPEVDVWLETSRALNTTLAETYAVRPADDFLGGGMRYRVRPGMNLDFTHRQVTTDSADYGVSSLKVRAESVLGGSAWTGLERAGGSDAAHAAVLGWSPRATLARGWTATGMFERRVGLGRAPLADPVRALPFAQVEKDRWTAAGALEYLPSDTGIRLSARGELQGGAERRGYRWDVAGDLPIGKSVALITRHDWSVSERMGTQWTEAARRERSLVGVAYRPMHENTFNALGKLEWRHDAGPRAGHTLGAGISQTRLIGAGDFIWAPAAASELAARYAIRRSSSVGDGRDGQSTSSLAHYIGGRAQQHIAGPLSVRADARLLASVGIAPSWAASPSLLLDLGKSLLLEGGYRFGGLEDADFGASSGMFLTMGLRFTEGTARRLADFWKHH